MTWRGYYVFLFDQHHGSIQLVKGQIATENNEIIKGEFEIDMQSIKNQNLSINNGRTELENHLKSDDFFSVNKYPKAKFTITKIKKEKDAPPGERLITGDLTIKDITHPVTFPASISFTKNSMKTSTKFKIDRTKWGIKFDSGSFFRNLGDGAISDAIGIELNVVSVK
ncbi:YceI family protein [Pedobacter frigoris]|uniref:YceI family protein n=2 Tax=Pedobacter frigoris TaxID=2571272 RepID=A0A4U1CIE1_9SPHI|nr:YceI family protein [Pedobacter frigoris]